MLWVASASIGKHLSQRYRWSLKPPGAKPALQAMGYSRRLCPANAFGLSNEQPMSHSSGPDAACFPMGDSAPVPMWASDDKGACNWFNQSWLDFTGKTQDVSVRDGRFFGVHEEDRQAAKSAYLAAFALRDSMELEYRLATADGSYRWVLERSAPRLNDRQQFVGYVGVCTDITYQIAYRNKLADRELVMRQLHSISERERSFLSCAIHDGLLQDIIGAEMLVQSIVGKELKIQQQYVAKIRETLHSAIGHGRRLIGELRPMILDEQGLFSAVQFYAAEVESRASIVVTVSGSFDSDVTLGLWEGNVFRIIQEALNNVEMHSQTKTADVNLSVANGRLQVTIQDYGCGISDQSEKETLGINGMRERAEIYGGSLSLASTVKGTIVTLEVPIPPLATGLDLPRNLV